MQMRYKSILITATHFVDYTCQDRRDEKQKKMAQGRLVALSVGPPGPNSSSSFFDSTVALEMKIITVR